MSDDEAYPFETPVAAVAAAVDRAVKLIRSGYRRGDVAPWAEIEGAAGFARGSQHWPAFRHRLLRDFRRQTGIVLWPQNGVGWKLLTVDEQLRERSQKRHRRARRQLHKDAVELAALPDSELSARQREERARRVEAAREKVRDIERVRRRGEALLAATVSTLPRVKVH